MSQLPASYTTSSCELSGSGLFNVSCGKTKNEVEQVTQTDCLTCLVRRRCLWDLICFSRCLLGEASCLWTNVSQLPASTTTSSCELSGSGLSNVSCGTTKKWSGTSHADRLSDLPREAPVPLGSHLLLLVCPGRGIMHVDQCVAATCLHYYVFM